MLNFVSLPAEFKNAIGVYGVISTAILLTGRMRIGLGLQRNFNEIRITQAEKGSHGILIAG